ncbi:unnamed protein product [Didymodactylos carnosus]|uniref:Uncharacterized protein n=1 Tax=Didymodactylos carnosus TaxID=1234261 RepID=A0A814RDR2_9BILA|nr:unnamed protein product [Didymodactylos carnosus]CAF3894550.1 unnamed protein product [Didymodactylos carnosus]
MLRCQSTEWALLLHFFIYDLYQQLGKLFKEVEKNSIKKVYRGQFMSKSELDLLQSFQVTDSLFVNQFFSVTKDHQVANIFADIDDNDSCLSDDNLQKAVKQKYADLERLLNHLTEDVALYLKKLKVGIFSGIGKQESTTDLPVSWWPKYIQMLCHLPYPDTCRTNFLIALKECYQARSCDEGAVTVYRGQLMLLNEIESLQKEDYPEIVVNSFFSTSLDREHALFVLDPSVPRDDDLQRVLFEIKLYTQWQYRPFGDISHLSSFPTESEILLMIGTMLDVHEVSYGSKTNIYSVKLSLPSLYEIEDDELDNMTVRGKFKNCIMEMEATDEDTSFIFNELKETFSDEQGRLEAIESRCKA